MLLFLDCYFLRTSLMSQLNVCSPTSLCSLCVVSNVQETLCCVIRMLHHNFHDIHFYSRGELCESSLKWGGGATKIFPITSLWLLWNTKLFCVFLLMVICRYQPLHVLAIWTLLAISSHIQTRNNQADTTWTTQGKMRLITAIMCLDKLLHN